MFVDLIAYLLQNCGKNDTIKFRYRQNNLIYLPLIN